MVLAGVSIEDAYGFALSSHRLGVRSSNRLPPVVDDDDDDVVEVAYSPSDAVNVKMLKRKPDVRWEIRIPEQFIVSIDQILAFTLGLTVMYVVMRRQNNIALGR